MLFACMWRACHPHFAARTSTASSSSVPPQPTVTTKDCCTPNLKSLGLGVGRSPYVLYGVKYIDPYVFNTHTHTRAYTYTYIYIGPVSLGLCAGTMPKRTSVMTRPSSTAVLSFIAAPVVTIPLVTLPSLTAVLGLTRVRRATGLDCRTS